MRRPFARVSASVTAALVTIAMVCGFAASAHPTNAAGSLSVKVYTDSYGQPQVYISLPGGSANLADVRAKLITLGRGELLTVSTVGAQQVWTLTADLLVKADTTLNILGGANGAASGAQVDWLRLRSDPGADPHVIDLSKIVWLKTQDGRILIEDSRVTSWDTVNGSYDTNYKDARAFVIAQGNADLDIHRSDLSYMGYPYSTGGDAGSYGVSWRDIGTDASANLLTRVTGEAIDSSFTYNYYGIYTFQARDMTFRGNRFAYNIQYGFDPHDFTHHVLVENNESAYNGNHGFIISRGCSYFTIRNNSSHDNRVTANSTNDTIYGIMLDPGGNSNSAPSTNNIVENNVVYNNDGHGIRILGSNNNIIRNNETYGNWQGISLERTSTGNVISGNLVRDNVGTSRSGVATIGHGIAFGNVSNGNTISGNTIRGNSGQGVFLTGGSSDNGIAGNTISGNTLGGVQVNASTTLRNSISQNSISGNVGAAISLVSGGNASQSAPSLTRTSATALTGRATPGATVEIFTDSASQAQTYRDQVTADGGGNFSYTFATAPTGLFVTATATSAGNTSPLSPPLDLNASASTTRSYALDGSVGGFIEAELPSRNVGQLTTYLDATRSNGMTIGTVNGSGASSTTHFLTFDIDVTNGGSFYVFLLGSGPNTGSDSFIVNANYGTDQSITVGLNSWIWKKASTAIAMPSGRHTLIVKVREDGAQVDKIYLSKSSSTPSGNGGTALTPLP